MAERGRKTGVAWMLGATLLVFGVTARSALVRSEDDTNPDTKRRQDESSREVRSLLGKYCLACHGEKKPRGGLNLAELSGEEASVKNTAALKHVWDRLRSRQMPP